MPLRVELHCLDDFRMRLSEGWDYLHVGTPSSTSSPSAPPGLLIRFGGHAMAAGATVNAENFEKFKSLFAEVACELLAPADLTRTLETDGNLEGSYISLATARLLENEIWGQGFPAPLFMDDFEVEQQRVLKEKHLKLRLRKGDTRIDAIQFNFSTQPGNRTRLAYRLTINEYMGVESPSVDG